jgi:hypothetical protein
MTQITVRVLLDTKHLDQIDRVAGRARKAGFKLDEGGQLDALGVLVGSIESASLAKLRAVPGVESVEPQRSVGVLKD